MSDVGRDHADSLVRWQRRLSGMGPERRKARNGSESTVELAQGCLCFSITLGLCLSHYSIRISAYGPTDENKLCYVESPFAEFDLRDERLTLIDALAQFRLRDAGVLSSLHEQFDYPQVEIGTK
ncbi:hypothetical protein ABID44_003488 [Aquamicrobium ahrensii]|uniref:Uncharacterized protein n=1 Tax=Aquamicrobium ahrensii TaxID=469551 RepID=A0ABV2KPZ3_9HYPH